MANFEVERKSKDMIKPFLETPNHLKTLQLSFLDQFAPPILMPYIFFYETPFGHNNNSQTTNIELLKNSLSQTLVHFYPLAGRVEGNSSIDCNDEGVEFYEADVLTSLVEILANPEPEELIRLLPYAPVTTNKSIVTAVQVNHFSCGSVAISFCISHKIADAATAAAFIDAWARHARGVSKEEHTELAVFDSASLFPPMDLNGIFDPESTICKEKIVTRRLIFNKEKLDDLKRQCDEGRLESPATRVGVVSALLWKKFIKTAKAKPTPPKIFGVSQIINLRTIKESPIPQNFLGNLFWTTSVHTPIEPETDYTEAVGKLKAAVKQIDANYLPKIKTGECFLDFQKTTDSLVPEETNFIGFSSWIRFPLYEINFGWGTPTWVSLAPLPFKSMIFLLPTKCGQGIEAWLNLLEHDVPMLEEDHELRSLVSHIIQA